MRVLADLHNQSLYESLRLLFEKRLGYELFRPIGMEWWEEGFWMVAKPYGDNIDTVKQYLDINSFPWDAYKNLNGECYIEDGIYHVKDGFHKTWNKAVTLPQFKEMNFDYVVSSIPSHEEPYKRLIEMYAPNAKHIAQLGNIQQRPTEVSKNILDSTDTIKDESLNVVSYHQEFDLSSFDPERPPTPKKIVSVMHLLPTVEGGAFWERLRAEIPDFSFESYGVGTENEAIQGFSPMIEKIHEAQFIFHAKKEGDGYGHVFHNAYAAGRPVITFGSSYVGRQGGKLFEHDVTGIDIEQPDWVERIKYWSEPENWATMSKNARQRFLDVVDFEKEEQDIRSFFERIV